MWWKKNGKYIIAGVIVLAVLAAAFYYGGNAPGLQGWTEEASSSEEAELPEKPSEDSAEPAETEQGAPEDAAEAEQASAEEAESETVPEKKPEKRPEAEKPPVSTGKEGMKIDPETGKDQYQTEPVPAGKPVPVEPENVEITDTAYTCTISISCAEILNHMEWLDEAKVPLVPEDGWILAPTEVTFYEGESVFNVLQRVCKQNRIHMEFRNTPMYHSAYIEGIHNLYEFDCGEHSGWMYKVNEWFPNYGCSRYQLQPGDTVCWVYTCELGRDVGNFYEGG